MERIVLSMDYDYSEMLRTVRRLRDTFCFLKHDTIGKSVLGKDIFSLSLGRGESVLYAAAFHGNEGITTPILLRFLERLCRIFIADGEVNGISIHRILEKRRIVAVPRVNPDGCDISLKGIKACGRYASQINKLCAGNFRKYAANARGVDINHNFNAGWERLKTLEKENGIYGPSVKRYGGDKWESEPETVALVKLCRKIPFRHVIAFHTQGEVIYWDYGQKPVKGAFAKAQHLSKASGYALDIPTGLAVGGGFKDWFIKEFSRPGFTVEFGKGINPLSSDKLDSIYSRTEAMLFESLLI